jgi:hypothetical protein
MTHLLVWDSETILDLKRLATANGHGGKNDEEIRAEMGDKFPKHVYHSIIWIGALIAHQAGDRGASVSLGSGAYWLALAWPAVPVVRKRKGKSSKYSSRVDSTPWGALALKRETRAQ